MLHKVRTIAERQNFAATSGVMKIPLGNIGGLKRLDIYLDIANGAGTPVDQELKNIITKARIGEIGGRQWCNCSGADLYALQTLREGKEPIHLNNTVANAVQHVRLSVMLGIPGQNDRYGMDLSKAIDPFLELTINLAATTAVGVNGYVDKALYVTLSGDVTEGNKAPNYIGAIVPGLIQSVTTKVEDPLQLNSVPAAGLVSLAAMAYLSGTSDGNLISRVAVVDKNTGEKVLDSDMLAIMETRPKMDGSVLANWMQLLLCPGRIGETSLSPFRGSKFDVKLTSLVAAGEVRLVAESLI